ncbi:MAG: AI-2E family transporter [Armatimonadota bacterium]
MIPLLAFYLPNDNDQILRKMVLLLPDTWRPKSQEILSRIGRVFGSYVGTLVILCKLYGLTSSLVLTIFGITTASRK